MKSLQSLLVLAANSLGEPLDVPERSKDWLRKGDLLVFEEARGARAALKAAQIHRDFLIFSEHKEKTTLEEIERAFQKGQSVVFMSDQGMPNLADPGRELIKLANQYHAKVKIIPGPSAITTALAACPFWHERFFYAGFLSREENERQLQLQKLSTDSHPVVILDTPYRFDALLESVAKAFEGSREALVAFDISGPAEDFLSAKISELRQLKESFPKKVNFVLVIAGKNSL